jgi:hypothetical protein
VPKVEVDAEALAQVRAREATLQRIVAHPEGRKLLQQAQKTAIPDSVIPEFDARAAVAPQLTKIEEGFAALNKRLDDEAAERARAAEANKWTDDWNRQKSALRQQGFMDDFIVKIEDHAQKEGIPNLRAAANDFLALNPPPTPTAPNGFGGWDFFDSAGQEDKYVENIYASASPGEPGGSERFLNAEIAAALADVRQNQPARR